MLTGSAVNNVGTVHRLLQTLPMNTDMFEEEDEIRQWVKRWHHPKLLLDPRIRQRRRLDVLGSRLDSLCET